MEQLSKDLQSGNLAAAQSDVATLQKAFSPYPPSVLPRLLRLPPPTPSPKPSTSSPAISIPATFPPLNRPMQPCERSRPFRPLPDCARRNRLCQVRLQVRLLRSAALSTR